MITADEGFIKNLPSDFVSTSMDLAMMSGELPFAKTKDGEILFSCKESLRKFMVKMKELDILYGEGFPPCKIVTLAEEKEGAK